MIRTSGSAVIPAAPADVYNLLVDPTRSGGLMRQSSDATVEIRTTVIKRGQWQRGTDEALVRLRQAF